MPKDDLRQAFVKVPLAIIGPELFGSGVVVDRVIVTNDDFRTGQCTMVVSGHESLPVVAIDDQLTYVAAQTTEHVHGVRSTEFRAFEPKRH